ICAWGFVNTNCVTVPFKVTGCSRSYNVPAWCANSVLETSRTTTIAPKTANSLLFIVHLQLVLGLSGVMRAQLQQLLALRLVPDLAVGRPQMVNYGFCPRLLVRLRIVNRGLHLQALLVQAPEAHGHVQRVGMRMTLKINPGFVADSNRVDDEHFALIFADRVPHPRRRRMVGMSAPIHVYSPHPVIVIEQDEHHVRELPELEGTPPHAFGRTLRQTTAPGGIQSLARGGVGGRSGRQSLVSLRGPRQHRGLLRVPGEHPRLG